MKDVEHRLGYRLESVGTYMRADGWCFPMTIDGGYDDDEGGAHHIRDTEPDGDWMTSLSDDDRKTVEAVLASQQNAR
jgi:hypothetical protein